MASNTDNEKEKLSKLKAIAQEHDKAVVGAWKTKRQNDWDLAEHAAIIHDQHLNQYLGFGTFDEWVAARNMKRSTVRRAVRIYSGVEKLTNKREFTKMTFENAELLLQIPANCVHDDLIGKAQTLTEEKLAKEIDKIQQRLHRAAQAKSRPAATEQSAGTAEVETITEAPERRLVWKKSIYVSQRDFFENTIADVEKANNLSDNPGRAMEIIFGNHLASDLGDAQKVISLMTPELSKLNTAMSDAIDAVENSQLSVEETLTDMKQRVVAMQKLLLTAVSFAAKPEKQVRAKLAAV